MELCGSSRSVILEQKSRPAVATVLQNDNMKDWHSNWGTKNFNASVTERNGT